MDKKQIIFLIGPMGAGKSTVGKLLANALNFTFFDVDNEIEKQAGASIPWIFDVEGEAGFRKRESDTLARLAAEKKSILATGGGAVLASANRNLMAEQGLVIYLQVSLEQQLKRVEQGKGRPLLNTPDISGTLTRLQTQREPLYQEAADWVLVTDNISPQSLVKSILDWYRKM